MAKKKKSKSPFAAFLSEPSLFDDEESTFLDNRARRRVYVHLVPAPWSRVILLSLVYALAVNFAKLGWFELIGRPEWLPPQSITTSQAVATKMTAPVP
jgi:hypothetical protein